MIRFEYALCCDEEEETKEVLGEARRSLEGVGVDGMMNLLEARGEGGTLRSRGERERRSGDEESGEDIVGV